MTKLYRKKYRYSLVSHFIDMSKSIPRKNTLMMWKMKWWTWWLSSFIFTVFIDKGRRRTGGGGIVRGDMTFRKKRHATCYIAFHIIYYFMYILTQCILLTTENITSQEGNGTVMSSNFYLSERCLWNRLLWFKKIKRWWWWTQYKIYYFVSHLK